MASNFTGKPPAWFWLVAIVLTLWECMGVWSWWEHWHKGAYAMGATPTTYDIKYFAAIPNWYVWLFALAVWSGLLGGILLLLRNAAARPVFIVSLIATLAMFGYTFLGTDLIAAKGIWTVYFPAIIIAICCVAVWFAGLAAKRGWIR